MFVARFPTRLYHTRSRAPTHDSEFGRETLSRWREPYGMRARLVENEIIEGSSYRYTMVLPTADVDAARRSVLES